MPQNPHSHKMNTNIMQMYIPWLILRTPKANEIQTYKTVEMNTEQACASPLFANFLLLICSSCTFIHLQYIVYSI